VARVSLLPGQGVKLELAMADVCLARYLNSRGGYDDAGRFREVLGDHRDDTIPFHVFAQPGASLMQNCVQAPFDRWKTELGPDHHDMLDRLALVYRRHSRHEEAEDHP
jgi:hypothetical protein